MEEEVVGTYEEDVVVRVNFLNAHNAREWVILKKIVIPGMSATSNVPSGKALVYFGLLLASGVFFVFIAFTLFLPVMVVMPQKFAICFTLGCGFIIGSFFALKGPKNQLTHMMSRERLPFTLAFLGSMIGTIYVSMVLHSYILSVVFSVVQVLSLGYYSISYFPGGSAGMKFLTSALTSSIMKCFGRIDEGGEGERGKHEWLKWNDEMESDRFGDPAKQYAEILLKLQPSGPSPPHSVTFVSLSVRLLYNTDYSLTLQHWTRFWCHSVEVLASK
ncbi:hypothetical protein V8G54_033541 [Vigna mungo]|uniref:Vesicle transport protein n=1 Tax=Vigna mungo TaxID=3915 RepID=A0AAQ3RJ29_VIGMU